MTPHPRFLQVFINTVTQLLVLVGISVSPLLYMENVLRQLVLMMICHFNKLNRIRELPCMVSWAISVKLDECDVAHVVMFRNAPFTICFTI